MLLPSSGHKMEAARCSKGLPSVKLHGVIQAECHIDSAVKNLMSPGQFVISPLHLRVHNFCTHYHLKLVALVV
jgi:hypothetical protein